MVHRVLAGAVALYLLMSVISIGAAPVKYRFITGANPFTALGPQFGPSFVFGRFTYDPLIQADSVPASDLSTRYNRSMLDLRGWVLSNSLGAFGFTDVFATTFVGNDRPVDFVTLNAEPGFGLTGPRNLTGFTIGNFQLFNVRLFWREGQLGITDFLSDQNLLAQLPNFGGRLALDFTKAGTSGLDFNNSVFFDGLRVEIVPPLSITQNPDIAAGQDEFGPAVFLLNWANYFPAGTTWSAGVSSPTRQGDANDPSTRNRVSALSGSQVNLGNWIDRPGFNPNGVGINIPADAAAPELALDGPESFSLHFGLPIRKVGFAVATGLGIQGGGDQFDQLGAVFQVTTDSEEEGTLTLVDQGQGYSAWVTIEANTPFLTLTFTESSGNVANQYFGNIVGVPTGPDTTPPVLTLPGNIVVDATSPAGATVNYTVRVTDNYLAAPTVVCSPSSGATFPIDVSTVNCRGTDAAGNFTDGSFAVTVNGPETQLSNMISFVQGFDLAQGVTTSLDAKLRNALNAMNRGSTSSACNLLNAFINEVQAQSGKKLTIGQADQLIVDANQARAAQGCP